MLVIPAIDIKDGQCVRLRQGRMDDVTVFGKDPVAMARHWFGEGCKLLHLVDLDGAVSGTPRNAAIIRAISAEANGIPVQVGGGIREIETINGYLEAGVDSAAVPSPQHAQPADCVRSFLPPPLHIPGRRSEGLWGARGPVHRAETAPLCPHRAAAKSSA